MQMLKGGEIRIKNLLIKIQQKQIEWTPFPRNFVNIEIVMLASQILLNICDMNVDCITNNKLSKEKT
jgi:histone deacetylase complex regulatory component SIN3